MSQLCKFYVGRKGRYCKLTVKNGQEYCGQHIPTDTKLVCDTTVETADMRRVVCPYDNKHSCYESRLSQHLAVCNARPKEKPDYIISGVNSGELNGNANFKKKLSDLTEEMLMCLVQKIESVFEKYIPEIELNVLEDEAASEELQNSELGPNKRKHLIQNSSLLGHAEETGFFQNDTIFVEFGAGRGQLSYYIAQKVLENENNCLLLIDRASQRHKFDNRLKDTQTNPVVMRIRADIVDVCLQRVPGINSYKRIVSVNKHLCGSATDYALRCLVGCEIADEIDINSVKGILMAFCCHHRCDWNSYAGREFLEAESFTACDFDVMCGLSSWAICGFGHKNQHGETRYPHGKWTEDEKILIGRKCKAVMNYGRQYYLQKNGFKCKLFQYVTEDISPENICILALPP